MLVLMKTMIYIPDVTHFSIATPLLAGNMCIQPVSSTQDFLLTLNFHLALLLRTACYHPIWQEAGSLASDIQVSSLLTGQEQSKTFEHRAFSSQKV